MSELPISISPHGAVRLGDQLVCDGFVYEVPYRVQTHIHDDHMHGFDNSKGYQDIYLTPATRKLLMAEYEADIEHRQNIHAVADGDAVALDDIELRLLPASHMLGAVQVAVKLSDGVRVGYSGDIGWPIDHVIDVDYLVIDSTNGSPNSIRRYTQADANNRLVELVAQRLRYGSVHIMAHRGTLQRALQVLAGLLPCPVIASPKRVREIDVYRSFGYATPEVLSTAAGKSSGPCVFVYSKGDRPPADYPAGDSSIVLSAFMCNGTDPFIQYSESAYRIALSDHADYAGLIEYVHATGAQHVLVDGTRGGHGLELSLALKDELQIRTEEFSGAVNRSWGT